MSERLLEQGTQPVEITASPQVEIQHARTNYRERFRHEGDQMSLLELSAGIALAKDDLRYATQAQLRLDTPYDGLLERQTASDAVSMALEAEITTLYERDIRRAGFANTGEVPPQERSSIAEAVTKDALDSLAAELQSHHPEWTDEELMSALEVRAQDIITLLSMSSEERDAYRGAMFEYQQIGSSVPETQTILAEMQANRRERVSNLGRSVLNGLAKMGQKLRELPNAMSARVTVASMGIAERFGSWYSSKSPEGQQAFRKTAAGVAVAGIAGYIAVRFGGFGYGGGSGTASPAIELASNSTSLVEGPHHAGTALPEHAGTFVGPQHAGTVSPEHAGVVSGPHHAGMVENGPLHAGSADPENPNPSQAGTPENSTSPTHAGTQEPGPHHGGTHENGPKHAGTSVGPEHAGRGTDLSGATTSTELFANTDHVSEWPTSITVGKWNAETQDGSLWGLSKQLLKRNGVTNPTNAQVDILVHALRPQAQPNGWLLEGQQLDLRPATDLLSRFTR